MEYKDLILRMDIQTEILKEILGYLRDLKSGSALAQPVTPAIDDLIDAVDVKSILKISDSTLYRLKKKQLVKTLRIGKHDYYDLSEIKKIASHFLK